MFEMLKYFNLYIFTFKHRKYHFLLFFYIHAITVQQCDVMHAILILMKKAEQVIVRDKVVLNAQILVHCK